MRSVLSNLVFFLGFTLGLVIAGYFLLVGGVIDVVESFKNDPIGWWLALWGLIKALLFPLAVLVVLFVSAAVSVLVGEDDWWLRRLLVRWQDKADAKYYQKQRAKRAS